MSAQIAVIFALDFVRLRPEFGGSLNEGTQLCVQIGHLGLRLRRQKRHPICAATNSTPIRRLYGSFGRGRRVVSRARFAIDDHRSRTSSVTMTGH
jgi:hypothetical protein